MFKWKYWGYIFYHFSFKENCFFADMFQKICQKIHILSLYNQKHINIVQTVQFSNLEKKKVVVLFHVNTLLLTIYSRYLEWGGKKSYLCLACHEGKKKKKQWPFSKPTATTVQIFYTSVCMLPWIFILPVSLKSLSDIQTAYFSRWVFPSELIKCCYYLLLWTKS